MEGEAEDLGVKAGIRFAVTGVEMKYCLKCCLQVCIKMIKGVECCKECSHKL